MVTRVLQSGHGLAAAACILIVVGCQGTVVDGSSDPIDSPSGPGFQDPGASCDAAPALPGESQRLNPDELAAALESVLGFPAVDFPAPVAAGGYTTSPGANRIALADIGDIADTADAVGLEALNHHDTLLSCVPSAIDRACVQNFVDAYAPRFYRDVMEPADVDQLMTLYDSLRGGSDPLDPDLALAGVISAMVQSPAFLYLVEVGTSGTGGIRTLTDREIANRMAFTLWDAPPDDALLNAADEGRLATGEGRRTEAERMLASNLARPAIVSFFSEWLGIDEVDFEARFPGGLGTAIRGEFRRVVEHHVFDAGPGGVDALAQGNQTWVNHSLAEHYGFTEQPADDATWQPVSIPSNLQAGLLSRAAVAIAQSNTAGTSIIHRGHVVRESILCESIQNPPPGATDLNPVLPPGATVRERSEARSEIATCRACHQLMDPIGIGMEDLDHLGRYRTEYDNGQPVDRDGSVIGYDDGTFVGVQGLGQFLASRPEFAACLNQQWFRFAMGRSEGAECHASLNQTALADAGYDLRELLLQLVASDSFVQRTDAGSN